MIATLHKHQHAALVAELRRPEYDGQDADAAFARVSRHFYLNRLGRTRFLTERELADVRLGPDDLYVGVTEAEWRSFLTPAAAELWDQFVGQGGGDWSAWLSKADPAVRMLGRTVANNVPGFPNAVRRAWFDHAWPEARG